MLPLERGQPASRFLRAILPRIELSLNRPFRVLALAWRGPAHVVRQRRTQGRFRSARDGRCLQPIEIDRSLRRNMMATIIRALRELFTSHKSLDLGIGSSKSKPSTLDR